MAHVCSELRIGWVITLAQKVRSSIKIVLLNNKKELLLLFTDDKSIKSQDGKYNGGFYQLVGGKIEEGETVIKAAKRELFEETGLGESDVTFGPIVWYGDLKLELHGELTHINQRFILAKTIKSEVTLKNLTSEEKGVCKHLRWMSLDSIKNSKVLIYPKKLPFYLEDIINGIIPENPVYINLG